MMLQKRIHAEAKQRQNESELQSDRRERELERIKDNLLIGKPILRQARRLDAEAIQATSCEQFQRVHKKLLKFERQSMLNEDTRKNDNPQLYANIRYMDQTVFRGDLFKESKSKLAM